MNFYLGKYGLYDELIPAVPREGLFLAVVIPCYNETGLVRCLQSLAACLPPQRPVEIIVVINHPQGANERIVRQSRSTLAEATEFIHTHGRDWLKIHLLLLELPVKDAGVGLARKAGMDEAVRRLERAGSADGVIVCLDADCTVTENYLAAIEAHFFLDTKTPAASIHFAHPYEKLSGREREAIVRYELFLRYYVNGLRYAGHPYAFHTIGSSMAVRNAVYQKQGGMNRRKAGEDFYFLQKLFPLGNFTEINSCCVFPSARSSDRVPFGTGRAIGDFLGGKEILFYDPQIFLLLKDFFDAVKCGGFYKDATALAAEQHKTLQAALAEIGFKDKIAEIKANVASERQFLSRFFAWFDGFTCLKTVHYLSDNFYARKNFNNTAHHLLHPGLAGLNEEMLLESYRKLDRGLAL